MDLGVNKPFKDRIRLLWEHWMANDSNISLTKSNYRKSVPRNTFLGWVNIAWNEISEDTMKNSFSKIRRGIDEIFEEIEFE